MFSVAVLIVCYNCILYIMILFSLTLLPDNLQPAAGMPNRAEANVVDKSKGTFLTISIWHSYLIWMLRLILLRRVRYKNPMTLVSE